MKLLDTSAWVEYFRGSVQGEYVKTSLTPKVYTSAITLAEIIPWFKKRKIDISWGISHIKKNSIIIPLRESVLVESGYIYAGLRKSRKKIAMIDVIIYMSAQLHGLMFLTKDTDFRRLPGVELMV